LDIELGRYEACRAFTRSLAVAVRIRVAVPVRIAQKGAWAVV